MNRATFTALTGAIAGMLATKSFATDSAGSHVTPQGSQRIAMAREHGRPARMERSQDHPHRHGRTDRADAGV